MTKRHDVIRSLPPRRAYALAIVLLVCVLLSAALTSMFFALGSATKLTTKNLAIRKSQYACDGVANLAVGEIKSTSARSSTLDAFNGALGSLRSAVEGDGVLVDELRAEASSDPRRTVVPSGGLAGLEVSVVDIDLVVSLRQNQGPPCRARRVQPLASLSVFEFPAFSTGTLAVTPSSKRVYRLPTRTTYAFGLRGSSVDASLRELKGRTFEDAVLSVPSPPEGWVAPVPVDVVPPTFPFFGSPEPALAAGADLRFWLQPPNSGLPASSPPEKPGNRGAFDADLRIIDGEWFLRDLQNLDAWPGIPIWSDHPCSNERDAGSCSNVVGSRHPSWLDDTLAVRRLYSHYERNAHGFLDGRGGAGVVSYGSVNGGGGFDAQEPAGFLPPSICVDQHDRHRRPSACVSVAGEKDGPRAALADAARAGFRDPQIETPRLPINIDVGLLGAAMNTRRNGELGEHLCLPRGPDDPAGCTRVFNGIVYVSATRGSAVTATGAGNPAPSHKVGGKLPWPLCGRLSSGQASFDGGERPGFFGPGALDGCDEAKFARVNAVRLVRAGDLSAFQHTGLTIITDLPVYVQRDWNVDGLGAGARTAIAGERVTVLSSSFSDGLLPPLEAPSLPAATSTSTVRVRASIFAGSASSEVSGVLRVIEEKVDVDIAGALATGFVSTLGGDQPPEKLLWSFPSELFAAQPPGGPRTSFVMPGTRR